MKRRTVLLIVGGIALAAALVWPMKHPVTVRLDLPPARQAVVSDMTSVTVLPDGTVRVAGATTTLERLPDAIDGAHRQAGGRLPRARQSILIIAGPTVVYSDVLGVWQRLEQAGWTRIARVDPTDEGGDD